MSSQRKDLPNENQRDNESLDFTEEELQNAWTEFFAKEVLPELKPGEMTAAMMVEKTGLDRKTIEKRIEEWIEKGDMIYVGRRRNKKGKDTDAWRLADRRE